MKGRINNIVNNKNFGFIRGDDGLYYFFHRDDFNGFFHDLRYDYVEKRLRVDVTFEPIKEEKGWRAYQVTRVDNGNPLLTADQSIKHRQDEMDAVKMAIHPGN